MYVEPSEDSNQQEEEIWHTVTLSRTGCPSEIDEKTKRELVREAVKAVICLGFETKAFSD